MTPDAPTAMDDAVRKVLAALPEDVDESVRQRPDDPDLRTWSYLPGDRPGRLTVRWPGGAAEHFGGLAAGKYHPVAEGSLPEK